jgi:predicted RNA-binding protein with RPS1 domain
MKEGDVVTGTVRTLMPYGAFIDLGGIDGLLHVSDIAHTRVSKPEDVLTVGQELQVKILKIDPETRKSRSASSSFRRSPGNRAVAPHSRPAHHRHGHPPRRLRRIR